MGGEMMEALDVNKEQVKADYISGMELKDICSKYNVPLNTLKSWVKRYHWYMDKNKITDAFCKRWMLQRYSIQQVYQIIREYEKNKVI